jgi:hypothetical protein
MTHINDLHRMIYIKNYRSIKKMELPDGWEERTIAPGGMVTRIGRVFTPADNRLAANENIDTSDSVTIEFFFRGFPLDEQESRVFRDILVAPKMIFEEKQAVVPNRAEIESLTKLMEVLGNCGNNQLVNEQTGFRGPAFILHRMEVLPISGKNVMAVRGFFQDPEINKRANDFCGIFIDGSPNDKECQVDEIFLQSSQQELYLQYLPVFKNCLSTIEWQQ